MRHTRKSRSETRLLLVIPMPESDFYEIHELTETGKWKELSYFVHKLLNHR
jgi:hypothetical protein